MQETESQQPLAVSALIVVYNRAAALRRCLTALERSSDRDAFEIIVVDNGSFDDTPAVQGDFPNVTWLRLPRNFGLTKAMNIAMRTGKGEYFFFLDPRTEVAPETICKLAAVLRERQDAAAACPSMEEGAPHLFHLPSAESVSRIARAGTFEPAEAPGGTEPSPVPFAGFHALITKAYFLKGLRYIDEHYAQTWGDAEIAMQIRRAGRATLYVPAARATWQAEENFHESMPSGARTLLAADWVSGAARFAGKHFGFAAGLKVRIAAAFSALASFRVPLLIKLLSGEKIDGTQTVM